MAKYTLEEIYLLIGKEDKVASIWFHEGSKSFANYGRYITAIVIYSQKQREELDELVKAKPFKSSGIIKLKYLGHNFLKEQVSQLQTEGISSEDILRIEYLTFSPQNTFHSKENRSITILPVEFESLPKGGDLGRVYHLYNMQLSDGLILCPRERNLYLAIKYFYEPDRITQEERQEIFIENNVFNSNIEFDILTIKIVRGVANKEEYIKAKKLRNERDNYHMEILDKYLKESGSSLNKLKAENLDLAIKMLTNVMTYKERRLNISGKIPIYVNLERYLHIATRHIKEMKVNNHFKDSDNFQWEEEDVFIPMKHIIEELDEEIQEYFTAKPGQRYSRYKDQSYYFEGDYYTFHIEPDGRISTFHRNKKSHEVGFADKA